MNWIQQHFFSYVLVTALILVAVTSYVRFMVLHDYVVAYEGDCDQYTESCFVGTDEDTGEEYYYSKIQKYAPDIQTECGTDITDCDEAQKCLPQDGDRCSISYCDSSSLKEDESCETLTEADQPVEEDTTDTGDIASTSEEASSTEMVHEDGDTEMGSSTLSDETKDNKQTP